MRAPEPRAALALLALAAALAVTGCEEAGYPESSFSQVLDLRQYLPEKAADARANEDVCFHRAMVEVGGGVAEVEVTWSTFECEGNRYLLGARVETTEDTWLRLDAGLRGAPALKGTKARPAQAVPLVIAWEDGTADGDGSVLLEVCADGTARPF